MRVKGQVPHSCQRKSLLAVCAHKVTARFQQPLNKWRGGRGEVHPCYHSSAQWSPFWVPGSQLLSGDYVQKHSSSRENEVSWRIKHRLKAGGVIQEGDKDCEPTAVTGDRGGRLWARTALPGVAAWMGESPAGDPEVVQLWGEAHWGFGMTLPSGRTRSAAFPLTWEVDGVWRALPPPASELKPFLCS